MSVPPSGQSKLMRRGVYLSVQFSGLGLPVRIRSVQAQLGCEHRIHTPCCLVTFLRSSVSFMPLALVLPLSRKTGALVSLLCQALTCAQIQGQATGEQREISVMLIGGDTGLRGVWKLSVLSSQLFCKSKITLK